MSKATGNTDNGNAQQVYTVGRAEQITMCAAVVHELREFGTNTTAHAIPRALQAERAPIRILWAIIFVIASIVFLIHLGLLMSNFLKYPISTTVSYKTAEFEFPDVTICNLLPFSLRKLELKDPGLKEAQKLDGNVSHLQEALEELLEGTQNDKESMFLKCTYNQEPCGPENFTAIVNPNFGYCFTFSPQQKIMANSPDYGLNVMIYAENKHGHSLPEFRFNTADNWEASGIRLVIHERRTHPHPDIKGVNVQTGVDARFAVDMVKLQLYYIFREGEWRCDDDDRDVLYCVEQQDELTGPFREVTEDCYTKAVQSYMMSECQCLSPEHEFPSEFCTERPINESDICDGDTNTCYHRVKNELKDNFESLIVSKCRPTCEQTVYTKQMSTSDWPSHISQKRIVTEIREYYQKMQEKNITTTLDELLSLSDAEIVANALVKDNFLRITVYPEALTANEIQEDLAYPLANFISEVGGILGLWLGGSMLTFLEPLEFFANLILIFHMIRRGRLHKDAPPGDIEAANNRTGANNGDPFCPTRTNYQNDPFCPQPLKSTPDPFCP